jgi:hypothetical protein
MEIIFFSTIHFKKIRMKKGHFCRILVFHNCESPLKPDTRIALLGRPLIELHPNNKNREAEFCLSTSWNSFNCSLKKLSDMTSNLQGFMVIHGHTQSTDLEDPAPTLSEAHALRLPGPYSLGNPILQHPFHDILLYLVWQPSCYLLSGLCFTQPNPPPPPTFRLSCSPISLLCIHIEFFHLEV